MEAVAPTLQEQEVALDSLPRFMEVITSRRAAENSIQIQIGSAQVPTSSITIPTKALHLLAVILSSMAEGKVISLIPSDSEVSTQQAADMLQVSRPHVVKLLEKGLIPFKKVGAHRRILVKDVLAYESRQKDITKERLQFLATQAQELHLGYE